MTAIATQNPEPPKLPALPVLSASLSRLLAVSAPIRFATADATDPGSVMVCAPTPISPTSAEVAEARRALTRYDHAGPARPEVFREWMFALNIGVQNPQADKVFDLRIAAYAPLAGRYPATVFDQHSLVLAQATFEFFPGTKRLADFLDARLIEIRGAAARLRRVADWQPAAAEPEWKAATDEERALVAEKMRAHRAWLDEQRIADADEDRAAAREAQAVDPGPAAPGRWQATVGAVVEQAAAARERAAA